MRRADRLFQIIQVLRRTGKPLTADAIAEELETSKRTIYRDIATLIGQRVPIRGEAGMGYILEKGFDLPPLMLTPDEIEAAVLGAQWVSGHPLCAEHGCLDLIGGEHQRRQVESFLQNVTHARLAADRHALPDQGGDVAVDRPLRGLEFGGDCVRRQGFSGAPEHLNDLEQPVGTSHGRSLFQGSLTTADSMLAAGGKYNGTTLQPRGLCP